MGTEPIVNLALIKPLLVFDTPDDYYLLEIIQRKKENPGLTKSSRMIKVFYIKSLEQLDDLMETIIPLCKTFNARAGIRLNRRSFKKTATISLSKIAEFIYNGDYEAVKNSYNKASGDKRTINIQTKRWIFDIDKEDLPNLELIKSNIPADKILATIPSKSGIHLITEPFAVNYIISNICLDIHKDNPTNLVIP